MRLCMFAMRVYIFLNIFVCLQMCLFMYLIFLFAFNVCVCEITQTCLDFNQFDRKDDLLVDECPLSGENSFLKMTCSGNS